MSKIYEMLIEREDGSRVWAELDPLDVASISRFLDTARGANDGIPGPERMVNALHRYRWVCRFIGVGMWVAGFLCGFGLHGILGW